MERQRDPRHDARSIDELINVALSEQDEDLAWDAVCALQWRGSREVLQVAGYFCQQPCPQERCLGSDILGQLGVPKRTFPKECVRTLLKMLETEADPTVLHSAFVALSHLGDVRAVSASKAFVAHADSEVRFAVALALSGHDHDAAIRLLMVLMTDPSPLVRDWATFGLGSQTEADSAEIREALAARLNDADLDTRGEALVGLARRGDRRAVEAIGAGDLPYTGKDYFAEAKLNLEEHGLLRPSR